MVLSSLSFLDFGKVTKAVKINFVDMKIRFWQKIAILVLAIFVSVVFFELLLRLTSAEPENLAKLKSSSLFLYENKPNAQFTYGGERGEFNIEIKINNYGFRDEEFSKERPEGVYRIAVLGDSHEEALQVSLYDTWQKIMAAKLGQSLGIKVETYNFGISGYGTDQQWLTLKEKVWQFSPDLVILAFSPNDIGDTYKNKLVRLKEGKIDVISAQERAGGNFLGRLLRNTYVYHLVVKVSSVNQLSKRVVDKIRVKILGFPPEGRFYLSDAQLVSGPFEVIASQKNPPKEVIETWQLVVALLADMKKQAQDHGAEFLVTINIPRNQVDEADWDKLRNQYHLDKESSMAYQINEVLSQMTNESGVTFYDPRLDATNWKEDKGILHFPVDGHFNQNGHIFMGEKVADFILSNNLVE